MPRKMQKKRAVVLSSLLAVALVAIVTSSLLIAQPWSRALGENVVNTGEITTQNGLNNLCMFLSQDSRVNDYSSLVSDLNLAAGDKEVYTISAAALREYENGSKKSGQNVQVKFGGFTWDVCYLTYDVATQTPVVTLLLADSIDTFCFASNASGLATDNYPANMYGFSKLNAYLNGTEEAVFATNGGRLNTDADDRTGNFSSGGYTPQPVCFDYKLHNFVTGGTYVDYLRTPQNMGWQMQGTYTEMYAENPRANHWMVETVWLPSKDELQTLWGLDEYQLDFSAKTACWTRSAVAGDHTQAYVYKGNEFTQKSVTAKMGVRPAIHVDLSKLHN